MTTKQLLIICGGIILATFSANAQVTIGSSTPTQKGALLELNEGIDGINGETAQKGLALPRVELKDLNTLVMGTNTIPDIPSGTWLTHVGLMVYHVMPASDVCKEIPSGIYVWTGKEWDILGVKPGSKPSKTLPITSLTGLNQPNSYIVTEPTVVKIPIDKARVIWDGVSWQTTAADVPATTALLEAKTFGNLSAEMIWTDDPCNKIIQNAQQLQIVDDYIEVWVGDTKGNAVIALKSDNEIVWSWHIWATDNPTETTYLHTNAKGASYTFMDRNLGATSSTPQDFNSVGLLYQWGRKDPFVSGSIHPSNNTWTTTKKKMYDATGAIVTDNNVAINAEDQSNLIKSINGPLSFIPASTASVDWYSTTSTRWNYRWGDMNNKAVTDPCPEGWHVPTYSGVDGLDSPWSKPGIPVSTTAPTQYTATPFDRGYNFTDKADYKLGWYPVTAIRSQSGILTSIDRFAYLWTTNYSGTRSQGSRFYPEAIVISALYQRANGFGVRCVKQ